MMDELYSRTETYGYQERTWQNAKTRIRQGIIDQIRMDHRPLTYSNVVALVSGLFVSPHDWRLHHLLGQISEDEEDAGRGLISAFVVRQGNGRPGNGFFRLAEKRGRDVTDREVCWTREIAHLQEVWRSPRRDH